MKLTGRFFLSHGGLVLFTLGAGFLLFYGGARLELKHQAEADQKQYLASFALAAREAVLQREDVAALNFMRLASKNQMIVFTAFFNPTTGSRVVLPLNYAQEPLLISSAPGFENKNFRLSDGTAVSASVQKLDFGSGSSGWVEIGYSSLEMEKEIQSQLHRWLNLSLLTLSVTLILGWLVSWFVSRHLVDPLKRIREGTRLVRQGKLDSLVQVNRADEIGDLARDFNSMVLQLKELDEMKRDFVSGVTHDLGTPLHAIRSAANFLQEGKGGSLTDKQGEYLLMISNNTTHLIGFINNLLTVARIEAAKVDPYLEAVDVMTHLNDLVTLYQTQAHAKGLTLTLVKKAPYVSLISDVTMFRQIAQNLLSNAIKFTDRGSIELTVGEENGDLLLEVKDTGIGIDPQYHELIFDKFFRVKQPKEFQTREGSGLGLSIVKGLVFVLGGTVKVESGLGRGSI
ncbi:MAG TPA: HAMP domain-containing sensor histidine kinase, partial [bacterium]|nr:HAMP domain-containing sensor histidine kinase [bacterium]